MLRIENLTGDVLRLHIRELAAGETVSLVTSAECESWGRNDEVITAIALGRVRVLDGDQPIEGLSSQLECLRGYGSWTTVQRTLAQVAEALAALVPKGTSDGD